MMRWWQGWRRRLTGSGRGGDWIFSRAVSPGEVQPGTAGGGQRRQVVVLLLWGAAVALMHLMFFPPLPRIDLEIVIEPGIIAEADIRAPIAFSAPLLEQDVEMRQIQQVLEEPPVLRSLEPLRQQSSLARFRVFSEALRLAKADQESPLDERSRSLAAQYPYLDEREIERALTAPDGEALLSAMHTALSEVVEGGVADMLPPGQYSRVLVVDDRQEVLRELATLTTQGRLLEVLTEALRRAGLPPGEAVWVASLLRRFVTPNLVYDADETRRRQDAARLRVPVSHDFILGEKIVGSGERITEQQSRFLHALRDQLRARHGETGGAAQIKAAAVRLMVLLMILGVFGWLGSVYCAPLLHAWRSVLALLFFLSLGLGGAAVALQHSQFGPFAVPIALVALLTTVLFKDKVGLAAGLLLVALLAILPDIPSLDLAALLLLGLATVVTVRRIQKRSQTYKILVFLSLFSLVLLILARVGDNRPFALWQRELPVALLTPAVSVIFALFVLPLLEPLVGVSSDLTLLELSDLNHPLLKRMALAVPGTYHHCQVVAQLAEQAARAIGANALLVRVGALFHDIGKMVKPEYYVENQRPGLGGNKHDELTPSMSALIIASHVREGIELARRWRLPREVIDFIPEHHGTQVMEYFYHKALEGEGNETVKVDDFRYPGPKPRRRETAVLMLADAVEAATRSLAKPTPSRIKEITKQVCDKRMLSGELDESQLTLSDVARIREAFIPLLTGIHHARIAYPGQREKEDPRKPRDEKLKETRSEET